MALTANFNDMLNENLHYELLINEAEKRNYLLQRITKVNDWKDTTLVVPFKGASASSFRMGALVKDDDISDNEFVRGEVTTQKQIFGAIQFHGADILNHDGSVNKASFLRNLPDQIDDFMDSFQEVVSINLLNGNNGAYAKLTADSTANDGNITVDRPERFQIGQKVLVKDSDAGVITGYVKTINMNTNVVNLVTARGGSTVCDFSAGGFEMTTAKGAACYIDGAPTSSFTSLRQQLLSLANGGDATLFGKTKLAYPYLQALNHLGSAITATNLLAKLFEFQTKTRRIGKGNPTEAWMSYKHLGSAMAIMETASGPYKNVETKVSPYGFTEITVVGVKGQLKLVGIPEMDDDVIYIVDPSSMKLHSNGFFRKLATPEGLVYTTIRAETGFRFLVDLAFFGDLVVFKPAVNGVIHTISY